jgi:hypothetical protein
MESSHVTKEQYQGLRPIADNMTLRGANVPHGTNSKDKVLQAFWNTLRAVFMG